MSVPHTLTRAARLRTADCDLDDFVALVEQTTDLGGLPARRPRSSTGVLVYDADRLRSELSREHGARRRSRPSWCGRSPTGPASSRSAARSPTPTVVDRATAAFDAMIADEKAAGGAKGDHFAKAGANDRVWNALEKLAVRDPETFVDYYANDVIALVSTAWLGPGYQVTSQVNVVRPGGIAQDPHRDYHLGFLSNDGRRAVPRPRPPAVAGADAAGRGGALRHAGRERPDDVPAVLPPVRPGLPRVAAARVPGVLRRSLRAAAARQGRRGVLQPRALPRRRVPTSRPTSNGWRTCCRSRRPSVARWSTIDRDQDRQGDLPGAPAARLAAAMPARVARRALAAARARDTRSRPTSTSTSRSAA